MIGTYKIADRIVRIESIYPRIHEYCKEYEYVAGEGEGCADTSDIDISIVMSRQDIEFEKSRSTSDAGTAGDTGTAGTAAPVDFFQDDYYEELAVHRKLSTAMLRFRTFLFHGSAISMDGQAYIFAAPSGTGKSTHTRLWRECFGDRVVMVNDDKPYIRVDEEEKRAWVYGTPFNGKHRLGTNICVPIKAICLLSRGEKNEITRTEKKEAYPLLLQQTYRPLDPRELAKTLELLDRLTFSVELYKLNCNMEPDAARVSYEGMHG